MERLLGLIPKQWDVEELRQAVIDKRLPRKSPGYSHVDKIMAYLLFPTTILDIFSVVPYWVGFLAIRDTSVVESLTIIRVARLGAMMFQLLKRNRRIPRIFRLIHQVSEQYMIIFMYIIQNLC